jgi:zinc-ribbon domain
MRRARVDFGALTVAAAASGGGAGVSGVVSAWPSTIRMHRESASGEGQSPPAGDCPSPAVPEPSSLAMSYDPVARERGPRQLCPKCHQPVVPGARFCANCGTAIGPGHSNIWPIVLAAVVALLVGAAIAFAIGGTGSSTKTVTQTAKGRVTTKQGASTVTVQTHTETQTQTTTAPRQTVTNTITVTTPTTPTTSTGG